MKILYSIILVLTTTLSFSQSLNKADLQPVQGENYLRYEVDQHDSLRPGKPGKGQLWDLSNLVESQQNIHQFRVISASSAPHNISGASYALEYYMLSDTASKNYTYYRDTADGYYELANIQTITDSRYTDPQTISRFPWAYGDSMTDDFCFTLTVFTTTNTYCGTAKIKFDGTGSLLLGVKQPIQNIVRLKYETAMLKVGGTDSVFNTVYFWYKPGIHHPLAHYSIYREKSGYSSRKGFIYSQTNYTSLVEQNTGPVVVYPNPCDALLTVQLDAEPQSIILTDILGNEVGEFSHENGCFRMETSSLSNGVYFLAIHDGGSTSVRKIVVNH
jgi:hypothetical protein